MSFNKTRTIEPVPEDVASAETRVSDTVPAKADWNMEIAQDIASSIENFLNRQIDQFADILAANQRNAEFSSCDDQNVQQLIRELEQQRQQFEKDRAAEIERLEIANEKLIQGWNELENEKRKLMTQPRVRVREYPATPNPLPTAATVPIQPISNSNSPTSTQDFQQTLACATQIEVVKRQMKLHANRAHTR